MTNLPLCELILHLLDEIILRSSDENRHFLVEVGLTQVLFNTLSSAISTSQEKIISCVQKCFNSLIITMFTTSINDDISFLSIIDNIIGLMMMNHNIHDQGKVFFFEEKIHVRGEIRTLDPFLGHACSINLLPEACFLDHSNTRTLQKEIFLFRFFKC